MGLSRWLQVPSSLKFWTRRPDGTLVDRVHPYRQMLQYIVPERNGAVVYFDVYANAEELLRYIPLAKEKFGADVTHCVLGAIAVTTKHNPTMNQFSVGSRLYQREHWDLTFSMKRKRMNKKAKLTAIKLRIHQNETFADMCGRIATEVDHQSSNKRTGHDKEYDLLTSLPRPLLRLGCRGVRWLDDHNLLPGGFIDSDPMYCSIFVANLGSLNMRAGFHHLYEWGTCPLFLMVGKIEDRPVVRDGQVVAQKTLHLRWSYDERIDDGLTARFGLDDVRHVLEHPFDLLGCVSADGSDVRPFSAVSLRDDAGELAKLDALAEQDAALGEGERVAHDLAIRPAAPAEIPTTGSPPSPRPQA